MVMLDRLQWNNEMELRFGPQRYPSHSEHGFRYRRAGALQRRVRAAYSKSVRQTGRTPPGLESLRARRPVCIGETWRPFGTRSVEGWDGSKAKDDFLSALARQMEKRLVSVQVPFPPLSPKERRRQELEELARSGRNGADGGKGNDQIWYEDELGLPRAVISGLVLARR